MNEHSKNMNKESFEHLSCLMDGEISKDTGRFLVRRLGSDSVLRATWTRYHVVRDCLRHHEGNLAGSEFSSRVQQALSDDTPVAVTVSPRFSARWLKPVSGVAIAASVALMAIVTVGPSQSPPGGQAEALVKGSPVESFVSPNSTLSPSPVSQPVNTAGGINSRQKMNSYLLRHYQVTGSAGGKGFVAFVPIVVTRSSASKEDENGAPDDEENLENGNETNQR